MSSTFVKPFFSVLAMSTNFIYADAPNSVTHSASDFFTTSRILADFQSSYHKQVFPNTNVDEPVLEIEFQGPKTEISGTVIDLKNLSLKLDVKLVHKSRPVKKDGTAEAQSKRPLFINNLGQSLLQNVEVFLNDTSVSSSNNLHSNKAILEAHFSHEPITKEGILRTQGYVYESDPSDINDQTDSSPFGVTRLLGYQSEKKIGILLSTIWQFSFGHWQIHNPWSWIRYQADAVHQSICFATYQCIQQERWQLLFTNCLSLFISSHARASEWKPPLNRKGFVEKSCTILPQRRHSHNLYDIRRHEYLLQRWRVWQGTHQQIGFCNGTRENLYRWIQNKPFPFPRLQFWKC